MNAEQILTATLQQCNLSYEAASVASTDPTVAEVVDLINEAGVDLALRGEWSALLKSAAVGALPADFQKLSAVAIDAGGFARVLTQPELWALVAQQSSGTAYYRIAGGNIEVSTGEASTAHYWSSEWTSAGAAITANADVVHIPGRVVVSGAVWRWLRKKGFPFDDQLAQHEADVAAAEAADRGAR